MKSKIIKKYSLVVISFLLVTSIVATVLLYDKYHEIYHTVDMSPCGLNISLYDNKYSRGFSWWTQVKRNNETYLYLSEESFDERDMEFAISSAGDICSNRYDGVYIIKGESESVNDTTRWGRVFSISYRSHTVKVENLLPDMTYYYAVGGNGKYLYGSFETDDGKETTIVNFNDFQTSKGEKLYMAGDTLKAALEVSVEDIDFFAFGGDFTSIFQIENKVYNHHLGWIKSRDSLSKYINGIPMVMTSGNHDASKGLFVRNNMISYDGKTDNGGYYSFDYNNVHFIVLNSNQLDDAQYEWLREDLQKANGISEIEWRIIMLHKGPYTTGDHGYEMENEYIEKISGICSEYKVDLVLQAHDHTYSKTLPYLWDSTGFMNEENDKTVVNYSVDVEIKNSVEYDFNPNGTYYVSCGASGHRIGENTEYALSYGEKSFKNRYYKLAAGEIAINSIYADKGDVASKDLGVTMFGVITIKDNELVYEFYAVNNGVAHLFDRLAILK